jgi:hypothetical protein
MTKDTIVQFVGFITSINADDFSPEWDRYAKNFKHKKKVPILQEIAEGKKNKFRYVSQHEWESEEFHFMFMNEKKSEHFREMAVKVVQTGGYILLQPTKKYTEQNSNQKLIAFISHDENDIDFYRQLPFHKHLNIYQAFYESCLYGYTMEFFTPEKDAEELLELLKQRNGVEAGVYREALVPHL